MNKITNRIVKASLAASLGILSACSSTTVNNLKPALLITASSATTKVIEQAISQALQGKKVSIASNAFLQSNQLAVEKRSYSGINNPAADGLIMGGPQVDNFSLFTRGSSCYLQHAKTGNQYALAGVKCKAS